MADDIVEMLKILAFALVVTWTVFYIVEIFIPYVEKVELFEKKCNERGGTVFDSRETGQICVKKENIIQ